MNKYLMVALGFLLLITPKSSFTFSSQVGDAIYYTWRTLVPLWIAHDLFNAYENIKALHAIEAECDYYQHRDPEHEQYKQNLRSALNEYAVFTSIFTALSSYNLSLYPYRNTWFHIMKTITYANILGCCAIVGHRIIDTAQQFKGKARDHNL